MDPDCPRYNTDVRRSDIVTLSAVDIGAGDEPPREFRLFRAGENESSKGTVVFDSAAAESVMAAYERDGTDVVIDLEHLSIDREERHFSTDACGWARLEVRDGELWAVDVRWTPDGDRRLREKRQRYVSPAFYVDDEKRVIQIINVGLTSMPATYGAQPLVAASRDLRPRRYNRSTDMNSDTIKSLLEAAQADDLEALKSLVLDLVASEASGEEPSAEPADEGAALAEEPEPPPAEDEEQMARALSRSVVALAGKGTIAATLETIETWRKSHVELATRLASLEADKRALEDADRRKLVGELVALSAETPATAYVAGKLCDRLAAEPVASLRTRVAELSKTAPPRPRPPAGKTGAGDLTETELVTYSRLKTDEQKTRFLALRASRRSNSR